MTIFSGTGVAVVTPFSEDRSIDRDALVGIIRHLLDGGVEYLVALGTTAETATLSADEQLEVVDLFFETVGDACPIVLGAGGNNTQTVSKTVAEFSKRYKQAAGILSASPYYNKPTQAGIKAHYKAVAESTDLPVILYNVPGRTASNVAAQTTLELAHEVKNIVAVKEASGDLEQIMEIIRQKPNGFLVVSGDDALTLPMMGAGADGVISVVANALPREYSDMVRAALAGDFSKAQSLHYKVLPLIKWLFTEGNPAGVKTYMDLQGLCQPFVRLPLIEGSDELRAKMTELKALIEA
ncbi:4-hydroxy-tetrahydrodipicolinate synthase [Pontibacter sp. G13]|uniref:4-hydroxy-tetrahydrodipicolinate synthase n=1 Tax=Pontibacter sp. G13 TaxID=3074898 RepID=UPI00288AB2BA|nr:4-hydroxy-tetrahydrodipicolinate synthase [Pontibacter sp. G13]WNJ18608.1 4-hydroxy-tetrahydrodipicolinate synthase [Pontibacter sp. G13]